MWPDLRDRDVVIDIDTCVRHRDTNYYHCKVDIYGVRKDPSAKKSCHLIFNGGVDKPGDDMVQLTVRINQITREGDPVRVTQTYSRRMSIAYEGEKDVISDFIEQYILSEVLEGRVTEIWAIDGCQRFYKACYRICHTPYEISGPIPTV